MLCVYFPLFFLLHDTYQMSLNLNDFHFHLKDNLYHAIVSVRLLGFNKISSPHLRNLRHSEQEAIFVIGSVRRYFSKRVYTIYHLVTFHVRMLLALVVLRRVWFT